MTLKRLNMNEEIKIWLFTWVAVSVSFTNVVDGVRFAVLLVSLAYSGIKLWDYINKRNGSK